jgi:hypothetical protein
MATKLGPQGEKVLTTIQQRSAALTVVSIPISSVKLWKDNPRKNDKAAPRLAEILKTHGQRTPIVLWRKNMTCYKGNTTVKAAVLLGWTTIQAVLVDFKDERSAIAYGIADNRSSEYAEWDVNILSELLLSDTSFFNKENTGFNKGELDLLAGMPNLDRVESTNAKFSGIKGKVVVLIMDAEKREEVKEMLETWIASSGLTGIEVK